MMMEPWLIGGLLGLLAAISTWFVLGNIINNQVRDNKRIDDNTTYRALDIVRKVDLVTLPIIGALIGHFGFGG